MTYIQPRDRTIFLDPLLKIPDLQILPVRIAATALEASLAPLRGACDLVLTPAKLDALARSGNNQSLPHLSDDLSAFLRMSDRQAVEKTIRRAIAELRAFEALQPKLEPMTAWNGADFTAWLRNIHRRATGRDPDFRKSGMRTHPDEGNNMVVFPSASQVMGLLNELYGNLEATFEKWPTTSAAFAYVGVIHCHPFADGNGRTARTLFNLLLSRAIGRQIFIPWSYWSHLNGGAFTLKVRRAMYHGDWPPLLRFIGQTLTIVARNSALGGVRSLTSSGERRS